MYKIVVDTRMMQMGGIGTYISQLLPHLKACPLELSSPIYSIREQLELPYKIPASDLYWAPHFNAPLLPIRAKARVVTIHDLFHLDFPQSFSKRLYLKTVLRQAIAKADRLITVSYFSKGRLIAHFPESRDKITVIHSGCDHLAEVVPTPVRGVPERFFLCVGNRKPHKNRAILFEALARIPGAELVIVDQKEPVSAAELAWLYQNAEALLFPSVYEGWGLPPMEAMSLGCPVIASHAASIPEACGDAALYFDPKSVEQLCERIRELPRVREKLIEAGKIRASHFTWSCSAAQHLEVFENCINAPALKSPFSK